MTQNQGSGDTINARRRRQGASSGPQGSERADAPSRQREQQGGSSSGGSGSGGSGPSFGGGGSSGAGGMKLPLWLIILVIVGFFAFQLLSGGGSQDNSSQQDVYTEPTVDQQEQVAQATPTRRNTRPPAATSQPGASGKTWTVMVYQDADDKILERDIYMDLNEIERVGSSNEVQIVAQVDRFKGAFSGDGNWTSTRRYHITQDNDLSRVNSELVEDLGEQDMADGNTLADFIRWAAQTYPADKYALILSDHGMGWPGGFSDPDPATSDPSRTALASAMEDDQLYMMELEDTLAEVTQETGKLEFIGMDACLMGHVEVMSALEPYARYAVLSQETEPALGWAYTSFLQSLVDNPSMNGGQLGEKIVNSYIKDDQRINDEEARAEFLRQGSPMGGLFGSASQISASSLAQQLEQDVTLTAVDLSKVPALVSALNDLSYNLQNEDEKAVAKARTYAPSFTNIFGSDTPSPYIDLGGFVQMLKKAGLASKTDQAADTVLAAIQDTIVAEMHGSGKRGATGISIYFPNSTLYRSPVAGPKTYTAIARHFSEVSLWDNFLVFFYNDIAFKPDTKEATLPSTPSRSPGLGTIRVDPITLSSDTAAPNQPVKVTTHISGKNIGYIYLFVGLYDQNANSIYKADTDYLESSETGEVNGVYYPVWNDDKDFTLTFDWEPTLFQITDGEKTTTALFTPQSYGSAAEDAVYTVEGIYHYADGNDRYARLYFRNGKMRQVFGFTDQNATGGAREIIPEAGDTFTILDNWLDVDSDGKTLKSARQEGETLTFGSQPFEWKEAYAPAGEYLIGIIVEDLDGNTQQVYARVTVQ